MDSLKTKPMLHRLGMGLLHSLFCLFVVMTSIWFCLAIWIQQPLGQIFSYFIIILWAIFALSILGIYFTKNLFTRKIDSLIYLVAFLLSLVWYFNIPAKQDREWSPEVSRIFSYEKQGQLVTIHNVRNFDWRTTDQYDERWETRTYNLDDITGVNIITSYWMGPQIAHTLVSFNFSNQRPLVFSIEIRKEKNESFSAIGGFFRQFELSLIAADEKDIVYTRSNIRGEQVYFFPVRLPKAESQALFEEYLSKSADLAKHPKWYNTLTSNCTTLVFDMVQAISAQKLPTDYRLIASGYLPNYLYDLGALNHHWSMHEWYEKAHVNSRTDEYAHFKYQNSANFSKVLRLGLPEEYAK
ncbi:Lnb N-terminal periplasmic domain-containing protein [Acinetobacter bereziniae]|uniref:Lnb N-terminal periplasmic domain-containing protein n=1 Tax=Acinetobacter bereziniae TaxID=106648 RepID=UPI00374EB1B2